MDIEKIAKLKELAKNRSGKGNPRKKAVNKKKDNNNNVQNPSPMDRCDAAFVKKIEAKKYDLVDEINIFKNDSTVHQLKNVTFYTAPNANCSVFSGNGNDFKLDELAPEIFSQLDNDEILKLTATDS